MARKSKGQEREKRAAAAARRNVRKPAASEGAGESSGKETPVRALGKKWVIPLAAWAGVALVALLVYLPSFQAAFVFDDLANIYANQYVHIVKLNFRSLYLAAFQDLKQNRPVSNLSFGLNYYFNALQPFGYHVVNFLIHLISGFALFLLIDRLLARRKWDRADARVAALLISLLWLVHPINTQAVTYIVQRQSSLAGCLALLSLLFFDLGRTRKNIALYILCGIFGLGAMLSKESAGVLPIIIFLYDLWFFQELKPGWYKKNWAWIGGLLGLYILVALFALRGTMLQKISGDFSAFQFTALQRAYTQGRVLLWYLTMILFPAGSRLSVEHEFTTSISLFHPFTTIPAYLVIFGLLAWAVARSRKYPLLSFSVLWYFAWLAIEALPLPIDMVFEHRLYLASIPVIAILPVVFIFSAKNSRAGIALALVLSLCLGAITLERNRLWAKPGNIWMDSVAKVPGLSRPWVNVCFFLIGAGKLDQARYVCGYGARIAPTSKRAQNFLGIYYFKTGKTALAEEQFLKAIEIAPDYENAYFNLGVVRYRQGNISEAKNLFGKILQLKPTDATVYKDLADAFIQLGEPQKALEAYRMAISVAPELVEPRAKLAAALVSQGQCDEALKLVRAAPIPDPGLDAAVAGCPGK